MCTAIKWNNETSYFGRNMDIGYSFNEQVVITPRQYEIKFKKEKTIKNHYAIIGMAMVADNYPLYADAMNEKGLAMAGLNFPHYAYYPEKEDLNKVNVTPYEFILWVLGQFETVASVKEALQTLQFIAIPFKDSLPLATLHFMISDKKESIVVESTKDGLRVFDNPVEVMTNNPTFDFHLTNLSNYMNCSPIDMDEGSITSLMKVKALGHGVGALGLPGDTSTTSRFVKAVFLKSHAVSDGGEGSNLSTFFHLLDSVSVVKGCAVIDDGRYDYTTYASCMSLDEAIYYYKSYSNNQIHGITLFKEELDSKNLITFKLVTNQQVAMDN